MDAFLEIDIDLAVMESGVEQKFSFPIQDMELMPFTDTPNGDPGLTGPDPVPENGYDTSIDEHGVNLTSLTHKVSHVITGRVEGI